jgi:hypothetical protein
VRALPVVLAFAVCVAPGAQGIGYDYFPTYGNGGYDVAGYDLNLLYDPKSGELNGTATITFRDLGDSNDRITATVTSNGNRTTVVLDGS